MDSTEKAQYKNLRDGFNYMIGVVLGKGWCNYEHDAYQSDTETIRCMIVKFNSMRDEITKYKIASIGLSIALVVSIFFNLI